MNAMQITLEIALRNTLYEERHKGSVLPSRRRLPLVDYREQICIQYNLIGVCPWTIISQRGVIEFGGNRWKLHLT